MKLALLVLGAFASSAFGAVTVNIRNFSSTTAGLPVVDGSGAALAQGEFFASAGTFAPGTDFGSSWDTVLAAFTPVDATPLGGLAFGGVFTGQDFNGASIGGAVGSAAYILIGNNADLGLSTMIAVLSGNTTYIAPDGFGNSAQTIEAFTSDRVVFGNVVPVTVQPGLTNAAFANGVQLVGVPEPSIALLGGLGLLGLLRRRRN